MTKKPTGRRPGISPGAADACNARLPSVRVTQQDLDDARRCAKKRGVTLSEYVRGALLDALWRDR